MISAADLTLLGATVALAGVFAVASIRYWRLYRARRRRPPLRPDGSSRASLDGPWQRTLRRWPHPNDQAINPALARRYADLAAANAKVREGASDMGTLLLGGLVGVAMPTVLGSLPSIGPDEESIVIAILAAGLILFRLRKSAEHWMQIAAAYDASPNDSDLVGAPQSRPCEPDEPGTTEFPQQTEDRCRVQAS